jgi:dienelactone hydrolase
MRHRPCRLGKPCAFVALLLFLPAVPARAQLRMEVIPFESVTLTNQQALLGETQGKPVTLAGELRLPSRGADKVPAVVLVHGVGGLMMNQDEWARVLNSWGIAAFILDYLSGRGITPFSSDDLRLLAPARTVDLYRALSLLSTHPRIDPDRIAVMGFSRGATATLLSSTDRFRTLYGPPNVQFAAYIGLYPSCLLRYRNVARAAARPIRLFHGAGDDWTPVEPCRTLVADLKKAGADVVLTEFPGATHAYDDPSNKERMNFAGAVTFRKCSLAEGEGGTTMNTKTGQLFDYGDPCLERGVSLQYDEAATTDTRKAVKDLLGSVFAVRQTAATPAAVAKAGDSGTAAEAKAMLERAVVALKASKADALAKFQKGEGGFKDRDLYVFCIGPDGTWSAHPSVQGQSVKAWPDADGTLPGEKMLKSAQEGKIAELSYHWPRPGALEPVLKVAYFTKVGDQVCGVGYYK